MSFSSELIYSVFPYNALHVFYINQNWKTRMTAYEHLKRDMIEAAEQGTIEIFGQYGM